MTIHGPRASILRVGVCEPLPNGQWYITGFKFDPRRDLSLVWPCPYLHNDEREHIGWMGWTFEELQALSEQFQALQSLETTDERL